MWSPWSKARTLSQGRELGYSVPPVLIADWGKGTDQYLLCVVENREGEYLTQSWRSIFSVDIYKYGGNSENGLVTIGHFSDTVTGLRDIEYMEGSLFIREEAGNYEVYLFYTKDVGDSQRMFLYGWSPQWSQVVEGLSPYYEGGEDSWEYVEPVAPGLSKRNKAFIENHWKGYYSAFSRHFQSDCY